MTNHVERVLKQFDEAIINTGHKKASCQGSFSDISEATQSSLLRVVACFSRRCGDYSRRAT